MHRNFFARHCWKAARAIILLSQADYLQLSLCQQHYHDWCWLIKSTWGYARHLHRFSVEDKMAYCGSLFVWTSNVWHLMAKQLLRFELIVKIVNFNQTLRRAEFHFQIYHKEAKYKPRGGQSCDTRSSTEHALHQTVFFCWCGRLLNICRPLQLVNDRKSNLTFSRKPRFRCIAETEILVEIIISTEIDYK
jgi:hypothetical protein